VEKAEIMLDDMPQVRAGGAVKTRRCALGVTLSRKPRKQVDALLESGYVIADGVRNHGEGGRISF
jgi:hypothetical protein